MDRLIAVGALLLLLVPGAGAWQPSPEPLFSTVPAASADLANTATSVPPKGVSNRTLVGMRLDRLFDRLDRPVLLNVDGREWTATLERIDANIQGHRVWVGRIEGIPHSHVSFAERNGVVSGLINGVEETFAVQTVAPGVYALDRVAEAGRRELPPVVPAPAAPADASAFAASAGDDGSVIDVLLLYTPGARNAVGGHDSMNALVARIISDTNTIFARSGIVTRVRLAGSAEAPLPETTNMSNDLNVLSSTPAVQAARDSLRADLVQLIMNSPDSTACGIGYLFTQSYVSNPAAFSAYSIADYSCASQYTPTHEMGHNMGSHHAPDDAQGEQGLYSYSFGYKNPSAGFRTVMAYNCAGSCSRIANFSNPAVLYNGVPTGTSGQNNALSINNARIYAANMRQSLPAPAPPAAPTGLTSQVNGTNVTVSWNPVATATNYILQVGTAPGIYNLLTASLGNANAASGSVPPGLYFWRVIAANSAGQGPPSAEAQFTVGAAACVPPTAPLNFTHTVGPGRVVTLNWAPPTAGTPPITYVVEAGSASGLANLLSAPVGGITGGSISAPPGTFFVRIRAIAGCGPAGPPSNERVIVVP